MKYNINWNWFKERWPVKQLIRAWKGQRQRSLFYGALVVIAIVGVWFTYNFAIDFSEYAIAISYTAIIIGLWDLFDSYVLQRVDTIEELKKGNTAYAIFLLAIAVLFHAVATAVW